MFTGKLIGARLRSFAERERPAGIYIKHLAGPSQQDMTTLSFEPG